MRPSSLESKTVRPGLLAYSYYASNRRPLTQAQVSQARPKAKVNHPARLIVPVLILLAIFSFKTFSQPDAPIVVNKAPAVLATAAHSDQCSSSAEAKSIIVSITQRHLWACEGNTTMYQTPVITGMERHPETLTPPGTYHVYAKVKDTTLSGSDSTGSWKDPVHYWMPFLDNQHGTYGFHDATWRPDDEFGKVDPYSEDASHGCVELPLGASKWLYEFIQAGTTVVIKS
jgi:lipoprotein-anchoring transpeptidase ErfK/SrfK